MFCYASVRIDDQRTYSVTSDPDPKYPHRIRGTWKHFPSLTPQQLNYQAAVKLIALIK